MKQKQLQHLFWRAGFGIEPKALSTLMISNKRDIVDALFQKSQTAEELKIDTSDLDHYTGQMLLKDPKQRKSFIDSSTKKVKIYNKLWLECLMTTEAALRERMTLFWANHFACFDINIYHVQQFNNTLRANALGNFGDFVKAISKEPAMLKYLNNKQNRKQKPNENFARELMELFMLGEGHYQESDIKESARAFTGYNHNFKGDFVLRKMQHDYGFKEFFGHTGRYDGDDIIDIILDQKQCARFICRKVYRYFVNEKLDEPRIEELTAIFYKDYNIENLMRHIFMSDWFYDDQNIGSKIKSPIDLIVGLHKIVPFNFKKTQDVLKIQKLLGQILLYPPNVAGWKGGKNWIDSNTIMIRLKLPSLILANARISTNEKGGFEDSFSKYYNRKENRFVTVNIDWDSFDHVVTEMSIDQLKSILIISELNQGTSYFLEGLSRSSKQDVCIRLMSLPEYQMC